MLCPKYIFFLATAVDLKMNTTIWRFWVTNYRDTTWFLGCLATLFTETWWDMILKLECMIWREHDDIRLADILVLCDKKRWHDGFLVTWGKTTPAISSIIPKVNGTVFSNNTGICAGSPTLSENQQVEIFEDTWLPSCVLPSWYIWGHHFPYLLCLYNNHPSCSYR